MGVIITIEFTEDEPERDNLEDPERMYNAMMRLIELRDWKEIKDAVNLTYEVRRFPKIADPRLKEQSVQPEAKQGNLGDS